MATKWAQIKKTKTEEIPEKYQQYVKVFNKVAAQRFPPNWTENYEIKLIENTPSTLDYHIYPLNPEELTQLDQFLKENL